MSEKKETKKEVKKCSEPGCNNPAEVDGLCKAHHQQALAW